MAQNLPIRNEPHIANDADTPIGIPAHVRRAAFRAQAGGTDRCRITTTKRQLPGASGLRQFLTPTETHFMPTRAQLEELLKSEPDDVFLMYAVAKACVSEGDLHAGLAQFDKVIAVNADYVPAYFQKGQALAEAGNVSAARESLRQGIEVAQRTGDSHALGEMTEYLDMLPE